MLFGPTWLVDSRGELDIPSFRVFFWQAIAYDSLVLGGIQKLDQTKIANSYLSVLKNNIMYFHH